MKLSLIEIEQFTREYGEGWGHSHVCRVLALIDRIGQGHDYDSEITCWAAWLHDWGAFPRYRRPGVDHPLRSRQIAESEILPATGFSRETVLKILEAIELHDYRDPRPALRLETLLVREADCLDLLGVIGIAREFAWGPNDLHRCRERILARMDGIRGCLTLPAARALADERLAEMETVLARLEAESFGYL